MSDTILTGAGQSDPGTVTETTQSDSVQNQPDEKLYEWTAQVKKDALIDDLKGKATLTDFVKHYAGTKAELEKLKAEAGARVKIPGDDATEEELNAYRAAVGVPESPAKYDLKTGRLPAGVTVDEETTAEYKKLAHGMGLTPKQAQALFEFDIKRQGEDYQAYLNLRKESAQEAMNELKKTYGEKYEEKLSHALRIVAKLGGDELKSELEASGLGNNKQLINFMIKVSENYSEDGIIVGSVGGSNTVNLDNLYGKSMAHLPDRR